jgi:hypothetical protein
VEGGKGKRTLENNKGEEVNVGDTAELLRQVLCVGTSQSEYREGIGIERTFGRNETAVYLLVRTLFRS